MLCRDEMGTRDAEAVEQAGQALGVAVDRVGEVPRLIGTAVDLAGAGRAGRVRHAVLQRGIEGEQLREHRVLADAARAGEHHEHPPGAHRPAPRRRAAAAVSSAGTGDVNVRSTASTGWTRRSRIAWSAGRPSVGSGRP